MVNQKLQNTSSKRQHNACQAVSPLTSLFRIMWTPDLTFGTRRPLIVGRIRGSVMGILDIDSNLVAAGHSSANDGHQHTSAILKLGPKWRTEKLRPAIDAIRREFYVTRNPMIEPM